MKFTKALPGCDSLPASLRRFLRKFADFLHYDIVELLIIAFGVLVIVSIWEISFWR